MEEAARRGRRRADRKGAEEAAGGASPAGGRLTFGDHGTNRAANAVTGRNRREALRRELDRWCACRRFVYQFGLMAKPSAKKGKTGQGGGGAWRPRMWRPTPIRSRKIGLAAFKHQQAQAQVQAERAAQTEQRGRAFDALARVVASAGGARPTLERVASTRPHRPVFGGAGLGQCCEYCRNVFTPEELKRHFAGGCPALKAG